MWKPIIYYVVFTYHPNEQSSGWLERLHRSLIRPLSIFILKREHGMDVAKTIAGRHGIIEPPKTHSFGKADFRANPVLARPQVIPKANGTVSAPPKSFRKMK
jgi:hypothetical protein